MYESDDSKYNANPTTMTLSRYTHHLMALVLPIFCLIFTACDDYFDDDISDMTVTFVAPGDSISTPDTKISIWWQEIDEASKYHLQIVTPSFTSPVRRIVDTVLTNNYFETDLQPARYECRVRAENAAGTTGYSYRSFSIDSSIFLNNSKPVLIFPSQNAFISTPSVFFKWEPMVKADRYNVSLKKDSKSGDNIIEPFYTVIPAFDLSLKLSQPLDEARYVWIVYAENAVSSSISSEFTFTIDRTAPQLPLLTAPVAADTVTVADNGVLLSWTQGRDSSGIIIDSVFLYSVSDSLAKNKKLIRSLASRDASVYSGTLDKGRWYYWSVVSYDKAYNHTDPNYPGKTFYVKPY